MFDIGGWEFLLIAILGIMIIGPKELPGAIRTVRAFVTKTRELAREFQSGLEEVAREAELDTLGDDLKEIVDPANVTSNFQNEIEAMVDPDGDVRDAMKYDLDSTDDENVDEAPMFLDESGTVENLTSDTNKIVDHDEGTVLNEELTDDDKTGRS